MIERDHARRNRREQDFAGVVVAHVVIAARRGVVTIDTVVDFAEAMIVVTNAITLVPDLLLHNDNMGVVAIAMIIARVVTMALVGEGRRCCSEGRR